MRATAITAQASIAKTIRLNRKSMLSPRLISTAVCRRRWLRPAFRLGLAVLPARLADGDDARVMLVRDEPRAVGDVCALVAALGAGGRLALGDGHGGLHHAEAGTLDGLLGHQLFDDPHADPLVVGQELHARGAHGVLVAVGVLQAVRGGAKLHHDVGSGGDGLGVVVGHRVFAASHDDHPSGCHLESGVVSWRLKESLRPTMVGYREGWPVWRSSWLVTMIVTQLPSRWSLPWAVTSPTRV